MMDDVSLYSALDGTLSRRQWVNDQSLTRLHLYTAGILKLEQIVMSMNR